LAVILTEAAEELNIIRAERLALGVDNKRAVDWAIAALQGGIDTESVVLLAGKAPSAFAEQEISDLIDGAATELGAPGTKDECLRLYARRMAEAFVTKTLPARDLVTRLKSVWRALREPPDLSCWMALDEDLYAAGEGASSPVEVKKRIMEEAQRLLR
jgi:hypothetical protein